MKFFFLFGPVFVPKIQYAIDEIFFGDNKFVGSLLIIFEVNFVAKFFKIYKTALVGI